MQRPPVLILFDHGTPRSIARWLHIQYQQNLRGRRIAIVILGNSQRRAVHRYIGRVVAAVNAATPGSFAEVEIPYEQPGWSGGRAEGDERLRRQSTTPTAAAIFGWFGRPIANQIANRPQINNLPHVGPGTQIW